jgi:hypothetical protein
VLRHTGFDLVICGSAENFNSHTLLC